MALYAHIDLRSNSNVAVVQDEQNLLVAKGP